MNAAYCYKQLKTGSVRFPRIDFAVRCAPQKVIPTPTNVYVTNIGALPVRLFFTFDYPMKGSDYFNFIVSNLTNLTVETLRYQPAPIYNIGGLIVENQYTIAVQAVIDGIPREISVPTESFSPGYGILQFTKRIAYAAQVDSVPIPSQIPGDPPVGYIAQRTASAICTDQQNNLILALADGGSTRSYILKYTNTGTRVFPSAILLPNTFTPYAVTTDSNSDIYLAGYDTRILYGSITRITPSIIKLSGVDGNLLQQASNNDLPGNGYFTGIAIRGDVLFLCGFVVSDIGVVQSIVLSKTLTFQELAGGLWPQDNDPDTGNLSVARGICIDRLGRPVVVGYTQTSDQVTTSYYMSIYEPNTMQRLLYFTNGGTQKVAIGESVSLCPDGSVAVCGSTSGQLDHVGFVGTGGNNAFVTKYNFSNYTNDQLLNFTGTLPLIWTKLVGSTDPETSTQGLAVAVDGLGGVYVVGNTTGGIGPFVQEGMEDMFVVKYSATGKQKYLNQNGSTNFLPFMSTTFANTVAINSYNDFFIGGVSDGIRYDQLTNPAGTYIPSIFISKFSATL
jgi:hypothetical protein